MPKAIALPSQAELLEQFCYDPDLGLLYWKRGGTGRRPSLIAGTKVRQGRDGSPSGLSVSFRGSHYKVHRVVWRMMTGVDPGGLTIDHRNRDPFDNRWDNLRLADHSLQSRNKRSHGLSAHKGVTFDKARQRWVVHVTIDGKQKKIGRFLTEEEAGAVAAPYFIP